MSLPVQAITPGVLEKAVHREFENLIRNDALARLWAKDTSLWPTQELQTETVKNTLGWLDLPEQLGPLMARVASRAAEIEGAGFEDVVFVTLGVSNLAAEIILQLTSGKLAKRSFLLESIDPDSVRALEETLRLGRTLFIFASKSGANLESHSLFLYFLEKLKALDIPSPAHRFVALTEENSYLGQLAREYAFVDSFFDPSGFPGRYSSLIHFNFYLATLCRVDPGELLARARAMREACGPGPPKEANPALTLGAFLAAAEIEGLHRLVLLSADKLEALAYRIGQLVGASTGKLGRGLIPIFGRASCEPEMLQRGCVMANLRMAGQEDGELSKKCEELRKSGVPMVSIELKGPEELAVEVFKWEIATALACSLLKVNPFQDGDVSESRAATAQILEQVTTTHQLPAATVRVREGDLELYAEGETRQQISTLNMAEALRTFFNLRKPDDYVALLPFVGLSAKSKDTILRVQGHIASRLGIPVVVTAGPRYLHTLGQIYKGGPAKGLFVLLTADPAKDLAVPGADYSFGQLQLALALGDFESLDRRRKPIIRLHLTGGAEQGLLQLETILNNALGKRRTVTA